MLQELSPYYPDRWDSSSYRNVLHILVEVPRNSSEYINIVGDQQNITRIRRVQHPLSFLRYALQDEYLRSRNISFTETIRYHVVSADDLQEALDYNCDVRRYNDPNPTLSVFGTVFPNKAFNRQCDVVIIVKFRVSNIETEKNHYPMYVINF